ncbi:putative ATP-dependent peptidase [Desulfocurvibacter africanus subsp. africanus str. Walvis Bay]|uniref:endopeptidase La n=2 Tax=Desulfocurvibacter africanus TaxID=873 RepID=F3YW76_DESAF|nr:putative ATP-dependent peptidase [Desulfocurvibacter africanus subsp. africanus str. Walvis Bay]
MPAPLYPVASVDNRPASIYTHLPPASTPEYPLKLTMGKPLSLAPERLRAGLQPEAVPYADSRQIPRRERFEPPQPRALRALNLAVNIPGNEYNVYLSGEESLGRTYFLRHFLEPVAAKADVPPDVLYVYNFDDEDRPRALQLPPGQGRTLKAELAKAVALLRERIPGSLEQDAFVQRREALLKTYQSTKDDLYTRMEDEAESKGFTLGMETEGQLSLSPRVKGKTLSLEEFEKLDSETQRTLRGKRDELLAAMNGMLRQVQAVERGFTEQERSIEREFASSEVREILAPLRESFASQGKVMDYLAALEKDVLANLERFATRPEQQPQPQPQQPQAEPAQAEDFCGRYEAHLLVDNSGLKGAPVIVEDHPTYFNLLGSMERESELGALYTDFTLIKPGALHRANHGYLILKADDVLNSPSAWEGLLRALRSGLARLEDPSEHSEQVRTRTIEPEPIPLQVKILLVGTDEIYEHLLYHDSRFRKLFKIKAHLQSHVARSEGDILGFLQGCGTIIADAGLLPFDREALAGLVDHASRIVEDQTKLSLHYPLIRELMIEASAMAKLQGKDMVDAAVLHEAQAARDFRANLYEEEFMADYDREIIKVATSGSAVGRVNGLSVTYFGEYEFGLPHHIACTVGVGREGIVDLEREAELGGPIHTKAMMILKSYLLGLFAYDKPLILSGSLYFEQSYAEVEGDSASGAELAALLSALAEAPIELSLAFTGAVNQSGAIMAVGGVTRKIEGFFEVCRRRGLTGRQGVLIPADNVRNLMLKPEVVRAVADGKFSIYPVACIEDALELLTGIPAGKRGPDGTFPEGTLYRRVDDRLGALARAAAQFGQSWRI